MITLVYNCFAKDAGNQLSCSHESHMNVCTTENWSNLPKTKVRRDNVVTIIT